jgi:hypothetical protein
MNRFGSIQMQLNRYLLFLDFIFNTQSNSQIDILGNMIKRKHRKKKLRAFRFIN